MDAIAQLPQSLAHDLRGNALMLRPMATVMDRVNLGFALCQVLAKAGKLGADINIDTQDIVISGTGRGFYPVTVAGKAVHVYDLDTVVYICGHTHLHLSDAVSQTDARACFTLGFDLNTTPYTFYLPVLQHDTWLQTFISIYDGILHVTGQTQKRLEFQHELEADASQRHPTQRLH